MKRKLNERLARSSVGRAALTLALTAALWLSLAATAIARDGGEGTYGKADDKVVTNFGFALIIFFPLLVLTLSLIQAWLNKRKEH
jgi:Na+-driven multidrug efflux pump